MNNHNISAAPAKKTITGLIYSGPCIFHGFLLGTDALNDPTITIFDNTTNSGEEVVPTCTYDASALGMNGVTGMAQYCANGLYLVVACTGDVEVSPQYCPSMTNPTTTYRGY